MAQASEQTASTASVHFDHHSAEFAADPWPTLANLRAGSPVAHSDAYGGFWVATGYEEIKRVALDDETFSSAETILVPPKQNVHQKSIPIEMDPPEFTEYRKIMQPLFAPAAVERLVPVIEYYAHRLHRRLHRARRGRHRPRVRRSGPGHGHAAQARPAHRRVAPLCRADAQDGVPAPGQPGPRRRARAARLDRGQHQGGDPAAHVVAARRHDLLPAAVTAVR